MKLYYAPLSAPCRSVMLAARHLGIALELVELDLQAGEHLQNEEFLALNPQHTVPTLVDGDFVLWESRAILQYLANAYSKNANLYPEEAGLRAQVDHQLYFDMGTLYTRFAAFGYPVLFQGAKPSMEALEKVQESLEWLEHSLEGHFFAAGNRITIADFSLVATVSTVETTGLSLTKYPAIERWLNRCKTQMVGYAEANGNICDEGRKTISKKFRFD